MPTAEFDTLSAAQELWASGISDAQAEAIAAAMRKAVKDHAASRADVAELRAESKADKAALRADLYRALWIQGAGIVAVIGSLMVIAGAFSAR